MFKFFTFIYILSYLYQIILQYFTLFFINYDFLLIIRLKKSFYLNLKVKKFVIKSIYFILIIFGFLF